MNFSKTLLIISRSMHFVSSAMISYHRHRLQNPYTCITRASFMEWSLESIHSKWIFLRTRRSKTIVAHTTTLSVRLSHVGAYRIRNRGSSDFINHCKRTQLNESTYRFYFRSIFSTISLSTLTSPLELLKKGRNNKWMKNSRIVRRVMKYINICQQTATQLLNYFSKGSNFADVSMIFAYSLNIQFQLRFWPGFISWNKARPSKRLQCTIPYEKILAE